MAKLKKGISGILAFILLCSAFVVTAVPVSAATTIAKGETVTYNWTDTKYSTLNNGFADLSDDKLEASGTAAVSYNGTHGICFDNGTAVFKFTVAGDATISVSRDANTTKNNSGTITAAVEGNGSITPTECSIYPESSSCDNASFKYTGTGATITITLNNNSQGQIYMHNLIIAVDREVVPFEAGDDITYNFGQTASYESSTTPPAKTETTGWSTCVTNDGKVVLTNLASGIFYNDGTHGLFLKNAETKIEFTVPSKATIALGLCTFGNAGTATVTSSNGGISPASFNVIGSSENEMATISYNGSAQSRITITYPSTQAYLHSLKVTIDKERTDKVEVWDFSAVSASSDGISVDRITTDDIINAIKDHKGTSGAAGTLAQGTYTFGDVSYIAVADDRYYSNTEALTSYSSTGWNGFENTYDDSYTSKGAFYANGTGGQNRRCVTIDNCKPGDLITIYMGLSASATTILHCENGEDDQTVSISNAASKYSFICQAAGTYKFYVDSSAGKPFYNRVSRASAVKVSGKITNTVAPDNKITKITFKNETTNQLTVADVDDSGNYSVDLAPTYSYRASVSNTGIAIVASESQFEIPLNAESYNGITKDFTVEAQETVTITGNYSDEYGITAVKFVPKESTYETITAATSAGDTGFTNYTATLVKGQTYTLTIEGGTKYNLTSPSDVEFTADATKEINIVMTPKDVRSVTGNFYDLFVYPAIKDQTIEGVTEIKFTDEYGNVTNGEVTGTSYTAQLIDGKYTVEITGDNLSTVSHFDVNGEAVTKNIYVNDSTKVVADPGTNELEVGSGKTYATIGDAVAAAKARRSAGNSDPITIKIDAGTYKEQVYIDVPNIKLVSASGEKDVTITNYYGIGYMYTSIGAKGFYDKAAAADNYSGIKNGPKEWGTTVYVGAGPFSAENIIFENSFNRYMTEEEKADLVEINPDPSTGSEAKKERTDATDAMVRQRGTSTTDRYIERAAAFVTKGGKNLEFYNCEFKSSQDTLYTGNEGDRVYLRDCYIEGMTDYIFSNDGNYGLFENCKLAWAGYSDDSTAGGYITATRGSYLFKNCEVVDSQDATATYKIAGSFGRPWGPNASVIFINTKITSVAGILDTGWGEMSGVKPDAATVNFRHYGSYKDGGVQFITKDAPYDDLSDNDYNKISDSTYLGDWQPEHYYVPIEDAGNAPGSDSPIGVVQDNSKNLILYGQVDKTDAKSVGFELSTKDNLFGKTYKGDGKVYNSIKYNAKADGAETTISADPDKYLFAIVVNEVQNSQAENLYVRVTQEMEDATKVYGKSRTINLSEYKASN